MSDSMARDLSKLSGRNPYNSHGSGCMCSLCCDGRMVKRGGDSANEEQMHLATAHALHHSGMARKHQDMVWRSDGNHLTVGAKAKHLEAAAAHGKAEEHFRDAARSFRDGLPAGAKEHMKLAEGHAAKATKMSEALGV